MCIQPMAEMVIRMAATVLDLDPLSATDHYYPAAMAVMVGEALGTRGCHTNPNEMRPESSLAVERGTASETDTRQNPLTILLQQVEGCHTRLAMDATRWVGEVGAITREAGAIGEMTGEEKVGEGRNPLDETAGMEQLHENPDLIHHGTVHQSGIRDETPRGLAETHLMSSRAGVGRHISILPCRTQVFWVKAWILRALKMRISALKTC